MAPPKKQFPGSNSVSGTASPIISLAEDYSFADAYKPFKDSNFKKNVGRRNKSIKQTLLAERERGEKYNREQREKRDAELMEVVEEGNGIEIKKREIIDLVTFSSSESPPSIIPQKKYCDVTGLAAPYVDPRSTLRYHNVEVYEVIKSFQPAVIQSYLAVRGNGVVLR